MESHVGSPVRSRLLALWFGIVVVALQGWNCFAQSVALTWVPSVSPNIAGYKVYYGGASGTYTNEISTGNVTNLTISGLVVGDTYYFAAAAVNSSGLQSALSTETSYTVPVPTPGVSITNVTPGMQVGNAAFTVMGTATDSVAVYYSLDGAPYATATLNGAQWSASLTLASGNNTIAAYAMDSSGDLSPTDTVSIAYVQTAVLTVKTNGQGIISPNYNGSSLQTGQTYTMTAAPVKGFMFTDWTGGTSLPYTVYTNSPTVQFVMSNNLVMEANFVDTNNPFISITNITPGMQVTSASFTVMGVATDNVAVASVECSLNSAPFAAATVSGKKWQAALTLLPGTNTIAAYATDAAGNVSTTATASLDYASNGALTVQTNGEGIISPDYNGSLLTVGGNYTMTATPLNGFAFSNWTGATNGSFTVYTNGPTLLFSMQNNLVLRANFVDTNNPFISITNVASGMQVTNGDFTVMGIATDNVAVASVYCSLNGGPFASATISGIGWSAPLTLADGTNIISAYATDSAGNVSATNTAEVIDIAGDTLTVETMGKGTVTPDLNGMSLEVGKTYTMTATAASGFAFTNWMGGTNDSLIDYTNKPRVEFTMRPKLKLRVNFRDLHNPYLKVTNAITRMLLTNSAFTVMGVATDDEAIATVDYSLNGAAYLPAATNGIHWSAPLALTPGTNTFSVYAQATNDNYSTTEKLFLVYAVSNQLTVVTNGEGIILPNYNGKYLRVGENYRMTAVPKRGFKFLNWSGGLLDGATNVYTTKETVVFAMASYLEMQANFEDTLKPYLKITNAIARMILTNSAFTVMGVATDDEAVASVNYSFNGGPYLAALTNGIHWSAPLTLIPGTNTFAVYAQATNGNLSVTDKVFVVYAVSNRLTVVTNGVGVIAPNYNGKYLRIGENYRMTAAARPGYKFSNWSGGPVGGPMTVYTTKPAVEFMMSSNLEMEANFVDVLKPFLKITNVTSRMVYTNPTLTVMGVATDNVSVAGVYFSLNASGWSNAVTQDRWAHWSTNVTLTPGTNTLAAYAVDTAGNFSATDKLDVVYAVSNQLRIETIGKGILTPNYSNEWLRIGENYSITAHPAKGYRFTDWIVSTNFNGGVASDKAALLFMMESNLTLQVTYTSTSAGANASVGVTEPMVSASMPAPIHLQFGLPSRTQNGSGCTFTLDATPGASGRIEYSTNLVDWSVLTNFVGTNGPITICDPRATDTQRYYRAVVP